MIACLRINLHICSRSEYQTRVFTVLITKQITLGKRVTVVTTTRIADSVAVYLTTKIGSTTKEQTITPYPILLAYAGNFVSINSIIYNCFACIVLAMRHDPGYCLLKLNPCNVSVVQVGWVEPVSGSQAISAGQDPC